MSNFVTNTCVNLLGFVFLVKEETLLIIYKEWFYAKKPKVKKQQVIGALL